MNEYIFYTTEGHTIAPNENIVVENCQILGRSNGNDENEAKHNLLKKNPWIIEAGYNEAFIMAEQIVSKG